MTALARPRLMRSARSAVPAAVVVGIRIAPIFITASIDSHSSTWLPSISSTGSPLPMPSDSSQRRHLVGAVSHLVEAVLRLGAVLLDDPQRGS